jgi:hypothetical protein
MSSRQINATCKCFVEKSSLSSSLDIAIAIAYDTSSIVVVGVGGGFDKK